MRTSAPGQSALLMLDVAELLVAKRIRYAVVGAMAAAVHGVVRASLDADAVVALQVQEAHDLRRAFVEAGYEAELRVGAALTTRFLHCSRSWTGTAIESTC